MAINFSGKLLVCIWPVVFIGLLLDVPATGQSNNNESSMTASSIGSHLPTEYQEWLDEDVRWIMTPDERAAFVLLSRNEDRDRFVQQFWLRRDVTPGTAENEYKEEHYRRIAYANQHFAAGIPGWETDRGRIYIVYGPPDAIRMQSVSSDDSVKPAVLWHYRSTPHAKSVDLKFVDNCNCGDYRLEIHEF